MSRLASPSDPPPALPVLEYGNPVDQPPSPLPLVARLIFFVLSLAAAASPFPTFTFHTSPLDVWIDFVGRTSSFDAQLVCVATPFFIGLPLAAGHLFRVLNPVLRRNVRIAMYVIGVAGALLTEIFIVQGLLTDDNLSAVEVAQVMIGPSVLVLGACMVVWLRRRRRPDDAAVVALQTGYASNACMLLAMLYSPGEVGWWVTLVAVIGIAGEWTYLLVRSLRTAF